MMTKTISIKQLSLIGFILMATPQEFANMIISGLQNYCKDGKVWSFGKVVTHDRQSIMDIQLNPKEEKTRMLIQRHSFSLAWRLD